MNWLFLRLTISLALALDLDEIPLQKRNPVLWTADWSSDSNYLAVGGNDYLLRIYDGTNFRLLKTFVLKTAVQCVDWNKDGRVLAIALDDQAVKLLNIETGTFTSLDSTEHGSRALSWDSSGNLLAVGDVEGVLRIYTKTGKLLKSISKGNTKSYLSVDWHPTKNVIATGSDRIRIFDTSGKELRNIKHRSEETILLTVAWHPGGSFFATGDYGHKEEEVASLLQFWNEDGTLINSFRGSKAEYRNIRWNNNGEALATASDALRIWSKDGKILYTGNSNELLWGLDWDTNRKRICTTSENGKIKVWTDSAELERDLPD